MRALGQAVVLLLVVLAVPVAAGLVLGDAATASVTAVGAVYGVLLALRAGWRRALAVVPVLVVVSVAAASSAGSVWWVVVLGVLGLATGWSARWGWSPVLALVGAAAASAPPLPTGAPVMLRFAWVAGAAAYAVVVARLLGLPAVVEGVRVPGRVAAAVSLLLGAVVAVAAVLAQQWGARLAYWLPTTVFLLVLPTAGIRWSRAARSRVLGTVAGVAVGGALAAVVTTAPVRLGLAVVAATVTVAVRRPVWANAAATTVTLMLVLDPGGTGLVVGEERLVATAAAAALVLAGGALLAWWAPRLVPASGDASLPVLRDVRDPVADEDRTTP